MAKNPGGGEARSRRDVIELFNETMATDNPDACSIAQDLLLEQNMTLLDVARANLPTGDGPYRGGMFVVDGYGPTDREWKTVSWTLAPTGRPPDFRVHWRIDIGKSIHLSPMPFLAARTVLGVQTRPQSEYLDVFPFPECEYRAVQFAWSIAKVMKRLGDRVRESDGEPVLDALYNLGVDGHPFDYDDPFTPQQLHTGNHPSGLPRPIANPRRNAPTTVDDVIQVAMDIAEEKRHGWWLNATKMLHKIEYAGFLGRRNDKKPMVVAQCVRELEAPDPKTQQRWLYRIWGRSRLSDGPYYVVSFSTRLLRDGHLSFFAADADATDIPEDEHGSVWPVSLDDGRGIADQANWEHTGTNGPAALEAALVEVGCTHVVPCNARLKDDEYETPASVRGIASARGTAENPGGQMSRATKTDAGVSPRALRMFRGFHKRDWRSAGDFSPDLVIPDRVHKLGNAKFVLYKSDKLNPETEEDEGWIDYIHEHDRGVVVCRADHQGRTSADVAVPAWLQKQTELVWLGDCNGFAYWDDDGTEREVKGTKPYPELYTVPSGKALLVIQNKRTLLAMFWGGRLGVEPRGIVH